MKRLFITSVLFAVLLGSASVGAVEAPSEIGGFKLGEYITDYPDIEYANYLREVVVNDWHGFRKGIISYGTCAYPGQIIKIRMKYENSSKPFYLKLLAGLTQTFRKPDARKALLAEESPEKLWKALVKLTRSTIK